MNPFLDLVRDAEIRAKDMVEKIARRFERKPVVEDPYWKEMTKAAGEMSALMLDEKYPAMVFLVTELTKKLSTQQNIILSGEFSGYSREKRADMAAIIAGQIQLLAYLIESPVKAVELVRGITEPKGRE